MLGLGAPKISDSCSALCTWTCCVSLTPRTRWRGCRSLLAIMCGSCRERSAALPANARHRRRAGRPSAHCFCKAGWSALLLGTARPGMLPQPPPEAPAPARPPSKAHNGSSGGHGALAGWSRQQAQHSTAQRGTAWHSVAQHAQHSTAQRTRRMSSAVTCTSSRWRLIWLGVGMCSSKICARARGGGQELKTGCVSGHADPRSSAFALHWRQSRRRLRQMRTCAARTNPGPPIGRAQSQQRSSAQPGASQQRSAAQRSTAQRSAPPWRWG